VLAEFTEGPNELNDPVLVTRHRKATRLALAAGIALALALVGAAAFGGTVLLGGFGAHQTAARQGSGQPNPIDAGGAATGDPSTGAPDLTGPTQTAPAPEPTVPAADPSPTKPPPVPTTKAAPPMDPAHMGTENAVLALVNAERSKAGCQALTVDGRLALAARLHSADMVVRNYFAHTTPDGVAFGERIIAAGYKWSMAGENIAAGQQDAIAVMRAWMNSAGHRANILNCRFRQIGIGVAYESPRRPVWTQDFGTPR
jgi:uncharacterized protein YkwD